MDRTVNIRTVSGDCFLFEMKEPDVIKLLNRFETVGLVNIQIEDGITKDTWINTSSIESIEITKETKAEYFRRTMNGNLVYIDQDELNY